ncbi:unnamed protein product [Linum tenue]|uniref:Uncharacterized protein n=1 Tax=Linum tenue TaxID=586396 RepID=A0AAV0JF72_9ROSI|nr:unnamed protein product [Linum tenue]CAI0407548.1 unnamed protein product [Linum tenue]
MLVHFIYMMLRMEYRIRTDPNARIQEWYKYISTHMDSASLAQVHSRRKRLISLL